MVRKTKRYCPTCRVILCKHCHGLFHSNALELPACSPFLSLIPRETSAVVTPIAGTALKVSHPRTAFPLLMLMLMLHLDAVLRRQMLQAPLVCSVRRKMRETRQKRSSALSIPSDVDLNSPPRRQISSMTLRSSK